MVRTLNSGMEISLIIIVDEGTQIRHGARSDKDNQRTILGTPSVVVVLPVL
jgi:hypothetical protein